MEPVSDSRFFDFSGLRAVWRFFGAESLALAAGMAAVAAPFVWLFTGKNEPSLLKYLIAQSAVIALAFIFAKRQRAYLAIFIAVLFGGFFAGELFFRLTYFGPRGVRFGEVSPANPLDRLSRAPAASDTVTGYGPGSFYYKGGLTTLNAAGFRGREHAIPKPPGSFRIAAFGASFTMGAGVDDGETWPAKLEGKLNADPALASGGRTFEVLNLGLSAANYGSILYLITDYLPALKPDLVVIENLPAHWDSSYLFRGENSNLSWEKLTALDPLKVPVRKREVPGGARAIFTLGWVNFFANSFFLANTTRQFYHGNAIIKSEPALPTFDQANLFFEAFRSAARPAPVALVLLRQPGLSESGAAAYRKLMLSYCENARFDCIDTFAHDYAPIYPGDNHPDRAGHERYATEVHGFLSRNLPRLHAQDRLPGSAPEPAAR
ncbi:MAG TPA: hypothetical protein VFV50_15995 [Bdellovibrionales bacterium]|nr:hypothetical protein [Bdellovibrionales bacterium]